jgi:hypothetical protein
MAHSPASWLPQSRPETSRLLKVDHYMLHVRIKMRLVGWAATSQNIDADTEGGVVRRFDPGSVTRGTACLTSMRVQGALKAFIYGQARRVVGTTFFGYRGVLGGSKGPWNMLLRDRR